MTKAIKMSDLDLPARRPKTKAWDTSKVISTGNIERIRAANEAAAAKASQKGPDKPAGGNKGKGGKKDQGEAK